MKAHRFVDIRRLAQTEIPGIEASGVRIKNALGVADEAGFSADLVEFDPGFRSPATLHENSCEMFYVISGQADFTIGGETRRCGAGTIIYFPENTVHIIETTDQPVVFLAIKSPAVAPGGDVVFVPDTAQ